MLKQIVYRSGFKYVLDEPYLIKLPIAPTKDIQTKWVCLGTDGMLFLRAGFAWDGPSGALDTKSAMRGSAIHDGLYRLFRLGLLDESWRKIADGIYRDALLEDAEKIIKEDYWKPLQGPMLAIAKARAWAHFDGLRVFGWKAAEKGTEPEVLRAP